MAEIDFDGNVYVAFDLSKKEKNFVDISKPLSKSEYTVANNIQIGKFKTCYLEFLEQCVAEAKVINRIATEQIGKLVKQNEARFIIRLFGHTFVWR